MALAADTCLPFQNRVSSEGWRSPDGMSRTLDEGAASCGFPFTSVHGRMADLVHSESPVVPARRSKLTLSCTSPPGVAEIGPSCRRLSARLSFQLIILHGLKNLNMPNLQLEETSDHAGVLWRLNEDMQLFY